MCVLLRCGGRTFGNVSKLCSNNRTPFFSLPKTGIVPRKLTSGYHIVHSISPYGLIHKSVHDAFAWCNCFSLILFCSPHSEGEMYSEELRNIVKCGIAASIVGMVYGGLPGARHARERFIQLSQAEMYQNRVDAVVRHRTEAANVFISL